MALKIANAEWEEGSSMRPAEFGLLQLPLRPHKCDKVSGRKDFKSKQKRTKKAALNDMKARERERGNDLI